MLDVTFLYLLIEAYVISAVLQYFQRHGMTDIFTRECVQMRCKTKPHTLAAVQGCSTGNYLSLDNVAQKVDTEFNYHPKHTFLLHGRTLQKVCYNR
uniref:Putative secreted protein n=1 Tax=Ixodes ricinus TaxID=34613 RepID=A0A147BLM0_IXORI